MFIRLFGSMLILLTIPCLNMAVAQVTACSANAAPISFPAYNAFAQNDTTSSGTVSVSCNGVPASTVMYEISLSAGVSGDVQARALQQQAGADTLSYQLYLNAARTVVWGNAAGGAPISGSLLITGAMGISAHTVHASIPSSQTVSAGDYDDSLIMTISF